MNNNNIDQIGRDIVCRSHSARSERDLYRVCPTKLNKKELEDLYFALLENNLELKRTINGQRDKIKILSTKVQRLSATQKGSFGRESRSCCLTTKAVVNEQKEIIADLKKSNERMSERIRLLNMRLCSAKQFVKRSPTQTTMRCVKCSMQTTNSVKNCSTVALNTNISDSNLKSTAASCNDLIEKTMTFTRSVQTDANEECEKEGTEKPCNENKCRTLMEELKQKIVNLQEELSMTHSEYSSRIGRLETEVTSFKAKDRDTEDIASRLKRAEIRNGELEMELCIEKGKVAELETSVKAAEMSSKVAATIEGHLANINQAKLQSYTRNLPSCSPCSPAQWQEKSPRMQQSTPTKKMSSVDLKLDNYDIKHAKNSDDSGYTEANKSTEITDDMGLNKVNQELMAKIVELQTQLDQLQVSKTSATIVNKGAPVVPVVLDEKDKSNDKILKIQTDKDVIPQLNAENVNVNKTEPNTALTTNPSPVINILSTTTEPKAKYPLMCVNEGQKTQEDTDEGSFTIKPADKPPTPKAKPEVAKADHNKYQIPGPIPSDTNKTKNTRRRSFSTIKNKNKESFKSKDDVTEMEKYTDIVNTAKSYEDDRPAALINDSKDAHKIDSAVKYVDMKIKDSIELSRHRFENKISKVDNIPAIGEKIQDEQKYSLTNRYTDPVDPSKCKRMLGHKQSSSVSERKRIEQGTKIDYKGAVNSLHPYKPSNKDMPATYTVEENARDSRASDKDTDHEISAMTDLPTEKDDKSQGETLSPGEQKTWSSSPQSYSAPTTDYGTLSEGELPTVGRARQLSIGERPTTDVMPVRRKSSQLKMEEALHAITEELARCKQMLLIQGQHQVKYVFTPT